MVPVATSSPALPVAEAERLDPESVFLAKFLWDPALGKRVIDIINTRIFISLSWKGNFISKRRKSD